MFKKVIVALLLLNMFLFAEVKIESIEATYINGELNIDVFSKAQGDAIKPAPKDWIGVYKKGDSNAWSNVVTWMWAKNFSEQNRDQTWFRKKVNLTNGEYEARYFKNNSFTTYKKSEPFTVKGKKESRIYGTTKTLGDGDTIRVGITKSLRKEANFKDWIGVYKEGDSNSWNNVLAWIWVRDLDKSGKSYYYDLFTHLENGKYEVRYFKNNSFTTYESSKFEQTWGD